MLIEKARDLKELRDVGTVSEEKYCFVRNSYGNALQLRKYKGFDLRHTSGDKINVMIALLRSVTVFM
jgi:hypothetical protein